MATRIFAENFAKYGSIMMPLKDKDCFANNTMMHCAAR